MFTSSTLVLVTLASQATPAEPPSSSPVEVSTPDDASPSTPEALPAEPAQAGVGTAAESPRPASGAGTVSPWAEEGAKRSISVAVLDLRPDGVEPTLAAALTGVVATRLHDLEVFRVLAEEDIHQVAAFEQMKVMLACADEAKCLADYRELLGVRYLVSGSAAQVGDSVVVQLSLLDLEKVSTVAREEVQLSTAASLVPSVHGAVESLARPLLADRKGVLFVSTNVEGVEIELDGRTLGTAPLLQQVPAGPLRVEASRKGFVATVAEAVVEPGKETRVSITLRPSSEFVDEHRRQQLIWLAGGWTGVGLGVGAGVAGALTYVTSQAALLYQASLPTARFDKDDTLLLAPAWFFGIIGGIAGAAVLAAASVPLIVGGVVMISLAEPLNKYDHLLVDAELSEGGAE